MDDDDATRDLAAAGDVVGVCGATGCNTPATVTLPPARWVDGTGWLPDPDGEQEYRCADHLPMGPP